MSYAQPWLKGPNHWSATQQTMALFISANMVNAGNLAFNVLFGRWLGPGLFSDLALLLTIKLSLMSIFVALQIRVTDYTASMDDAQRRTFAHWLNDEMRRLIIIVAAIGLPLIYVIYRNSAALPFSSPHLLPALVLCFPAMVPLCLKRGIAQGAMDIRSIIASAQAEMVVRLFGSIAAWHLGFGLEGVSLAIAASIIAGWYFAGFQAIENLSHNAAKHWGAINFGLWPWAALQLAQVLHLDGEAITAKINMSAKAAGEVAALDLMQRIFFFACFALSAALIPLVAKAMRSQSPVWPAIKPIFCIIGVCAFGFMVALLLLPKLVITLMFGEAFIAIAPTAWLAGSTAILFTFTYLLATLGMALGVKNIGYVLLGFGAAQMALFWLVSQHAMANATWLFQAKLGCQLCFLAYCLWAVLSPQRRLHARTSY